MTDAIIKTSIVQPSSDVTDQDIDTLAQLAASIGK
jgi:hypothetical protein